MTLEYIDSNGEYRKINNINKIHNLFYDEIYVSTYSGKEYTLKNIIIYNVFNKDYL